MPGTLRVMAPGTQSAPMVGREEELSTLSGRLKTAALGRGQVVLIEGEAGIGKTRLLDEALQVADEDGFAVRRAGCEEIEQMLPFRLILRALQGESESPDSPLLVIQELLTGRLEEETPLLPTQSELRYRVLEEMLSLVEHEASSQPLLIVLEDLQWADPSSLLALRTLARRVPPLRVALLASMRPSPRSAELTGVIDTLLSEGATDVRLHSLHDRSAWDLIEMRVGHPPGDRLRTVAAGAGGNPLFLEELLRSLRESDAIEIVDGRAEVKEVPLPRSLREAILGRINFLSPKTMQVLQMASVLGTRFDADDLCACVGTSMIELVSALGEATRAGLIEGVAERMTFRHELLQAVLYEELGPGLRGALHREAARVLAAAGRPAGEVAMHLAVGASIGDVETIGWLRRAARSAAPRAPGSATDLLRSAVDLVDPSYEQSDELVAELVASLVWSGQAPEAEKLAIETLPRVHDSGTLGSLRWSLAVASAMQGKLPEALSHTQAAAEEPGLPRWRRARLLADASQWRFYTGDVDGAQTVAQRAIEEGSSCGDEVATALGYSALSRVAMERCDFALAISLGHKALSTISGTLAERTETEWIHPSFDLAGALVVADRLTEAQEMLQTGRRLRERLGSTWDLPLFTNTLAHTHLYRGEWGDAVTEAETTLSLMEDGGAKGSALWVLSLLAYVAIHREGVEAASEFLGRAEQTIQQTGPLMGADQVMWCAALVHETLGDQDRAWASVHEAWHLRLPFKPVTRSRMAVDAVRLAQATGHHAEAREVVVDLQRLADAAGAPLYEGIALHCRGLVDDDEEACLRSVTVLRDSSRLIDLASACESAGAALMTRGRTAEGGELLREAVGRYEYFGAFRDVTRVEATLRSAGLRPGRRGKRSKERMGWPSLSRTERDVVDLVTRGLTNREVGARLFISRRTVETHLSHVFRKLNVSSRVELAAMAAVHPAGSGREAGEGGAHPDG